MKEILINGKSKIIIGEDFSKIEKYLPQQRTIIITDENIEKYYSKSFPNFPIIKVALGEKNKTLSSVESVLNQLLELGADRHTFLLGIGGGIVCDITGFAASIFMRGIGFGFISSSILSQVDASVGGKNGVNLNAYKNLIGNINQPSLVLCDTKMLETLPKKEIISGMAEIVKHSLIADARMFTFIGDNSANILNLDQSILPNLIFDNIKIKASFVEKDEEEKGERKKLNFGHTLAHAIEKHSNYTHGEAVAIGIVFASKVSFSKKYISELDLERIVNTLEKIGLPTQLDIDKDKITEAIFKDKKRKGDQLSFILLEKIGTAKIEEMKMSELKQWIYDLC